MKNKIAGNAILLIFLLAFIASLFLKYAGISETMYAIMLCIGLWILAAYFIFRTTAPLSGNGRGLMTVVILGISGVIITPILWSMGDLGVLERMTVTGLVLTPVCLISKIVHTWFQISRTRNVKEN